MPTYFWVFVHITPAFWATYHILLYKRDTRSATGWIIVCLFVPYGGPIAYYLFGINRVRKRAQGIRRQVFGVDYEAGRRIAYSRESQGYGLQTAGYRTTGRALTAGNVVSPLFNGDEAYPSMLEAIASAKKTIVLATYLFQVDAVGEVFIVALEAAKERGVEVQVLVDGIGERYSLRRSTKQLAKRGIDVVRFLPPTLFPPSIYINLRNHRKVLVVDDEVAFAGGMNIAMDNTIQGDLARSVTDLHFKLCGPIVVELAALFAQDWQYAAAIQAEMDIPRTPCVAGAMECRLIADGPDENLETLALTLEAVVGSANKHIRIMTPYFLPNRELFAALLSAALRGVHVQIVLPEKNNLFYIPWANRNLLVELTKWDVDVYYQLPPFCHTKILCIDDNYSLIGSANLDPRSLRLNFELGIEVFSEEFNQKLVSHFESTIVSSKKAMYEELADRSIYSRLRDSATSLLSPYL